MLHEPATPSGRDPAGPYKARLGIWMFALYTVFYAGFVAINLLSPPTMATIVVAGLNLATVYGMGLIVLAIVQALIYNHMCTRREDELARLEASAGQATEPDDPAGRDEAPDTTDGES
jgi:uncharacterized membrane protein (DUF485 family)